MTKLEQRYRFEAVPSKMNDGQMIVVLDEAVQRWEVQLHSRVMNLLYELKSGEFIGARYGPCNATVVRQGWFSEDILLTAPLPPEIDRTLPERAFRFLLAWQLRQPESLKHFLDEPPPDPRALEYWSRLAGWEPFRTKLAKPRDASCRSYIPLVTALCRLAELLPAWDVLEPFLDEAPLRIVGDEVLRQANVSDPHWFLREHLGKAQPVDKEREPDPKYLAELKLMVGLLCKRLFTPIAAYEARLLSKDSPHYPSREELVIAAEALKCLEPEMQRWLPTIKDRLADAVEEAGLSILPEPLPERSTSSLEVTETLTCAERQALEAYEYAIARISHSPGQELEAAQVYAWLVEHGCGDDLEEYKLPSLTSWQRMKNRAQRKLKALPERLRMGTGRSIVEGDQL